MVIARYPDEITVRAIWEMAAVRSARRYKSADASGEAGKEIDPTLKCEHEGQREGKIHESEILTESAKRSIPG